MLSPVIDDGSHLNNLSSSHHQSSRFYCSLFDDYSGCFDAAMRVVGLNDESLGHAVLGGIDIVKFSLLQNELSQKIDVSTIPSADMDYWDFSNMPLNIEVQPVID